MEITSQNDKSFPSLSVFLEFFSSLDKLYVLKVIILYCRFTFNVKFMDVLISYKNKQLCKISH